MLASASSAFEVAVDGARREVEIRDVESAIRGALAQVVAAVSDDLKPISVGIATTASTVAIVDPGDGEPEGPGIMWADHRATRQAAMIRAAGHPNLHRMLDHVSPEWGIAKLAWLASAGALDRSSGIVVELADWLGFRATGIWAANAGTREWGWAGGDDGRVIGTLLEAAGARGTAAERVISEVRPTGSVLDVVQAASGWPAKLFDIPVLVGGMDSYLAAVGMGAASPGRLCITVGSSSAAIGGLACGDARERMFGPLRTAVPGLTDGAWQGGQTTAGLAAAWARTALGGSDAALDRAAADAPPGSRGVTFRETMLDRRNPDPRSPLRGAWSGLRLDHARGDLYRAVLEGSRSDSPKRVAASSLPRSSRPAECCGTISSARSSPTSSSDRWRASGRRTPPRPLGRHSADVPERVAALIPTAATIEPSGADYEEARIRYLRASFPDLDEGVSET